MQLIILMGLQACGKSTFYRENFFYTHMRISLDMLKTRHRERELVTRCFELKQRLVIDNTNPTLEDRARYIEPAREHGFEVVGYFFQSTLQDALRRNTKRSGKHRIPDAGLRHCAKRLVMPSMDEGFDMIYHVRLAPALQFIVDVVPSVGPSSS